MKRLKVYTKPVDPIGYPDGLARSIHFSLIDETEELELNRGYGILFCKGEISDEDLIVPKAVKNPKIFLKEDGEFVITAVRTEEDGSPEPVLRAVSWETREFIHFKENKAYAEKEDDAGVANEFQEISGMSSADEILISDSMAEQVKAYWNPKQAERLTEFPKAPGFGDPVFFRYGDKWYYLSTNDNVNDIGLFIREGDSIDELLSEDAELHLILDVDQEKKYLQTFWAPEAHRIGGELYIFFAISGDVFGPHCHMLRLKKGCPLTEASSWEDMGPSRRKDGTILTKPETVLSDEEKKALPPVGKRAEDNRFGISLDMTYFEAAGRSYVVWSYRGGIGTPLDTGSMLMIAEVKPEAPWQLITDPVLISRPLYGFENVRGTINNEGPYVYKKNGRVYINYSGGDARGYLYCINILSADENADLLSSDSWHKRLTPIGNFKTWDGIYGPGHNSWFRDENGKDWIVFHAVTGIGERIVCTGIVEYPENLD